MKKIGFLAADVSKGYADFVLWDQQGNLLESAFKLMDNKEGHQQAKQLVKEFMKHYELTEVYVGMESTGVAMRITGFYCSGPCKARE